MSTTPQTPPATVTATATMKAVIGRSYGSPDLLKVEEVARPPVGESDVLVRVHAAGLDQGVWHTVTGLPYGIRAAGFGLIRPKTPVPGSDVAGVVEAIGPGVTRFAVGDEVYGTCDGSFAQYACAHPAKLAIKPATLSFEQAAAVPVSALTALQAVRDQGQVEAGEKVLVVGASGGVGTFAVQIAKAFGAEVTGVCSAPKADLVRALGADHVLDYTQEDFTRGEQRYDVIVDTGGNRPLSDLRRALTPRGRLVLVGGETGGRLLGGSERSIRALLLSPLVSQKLATFIASENAADLVVLRDLIDAGKLAPAIDRTYPLSEVAAAITHMQDGHARGKIVISVQPVVPLTYPKGVYV